MYIKYLSVNVQIIYIYIYIYIYNTYVTEFWKITLMAVPETIRIFETSMVLLIVENTF